ncbi:hypothetical protein DFP72DRAFT_1054198 [Ephemerocybe angulata]|uniref:Uncharacterized protein n=1 Tax=Ephemerocybe angulata TaxID=980116 RepID=A0A8H6H9Z1_9AGAR|nr:hypothetical protein DFP72DRAFT_1054198 [Tulosesus angulatus]
MVKVINAILLATVVAGPSLALANSHHHDGINSREISAAEAEIFSRAIETEFTAVFGREFEGIENLSAREIEELSERSPIFGKIFRGAKRVVGGLFGRDIETFDELTEREIEELSERSPIFGKIFRGAKRVVGGLFGRELEEDLELSGRSPIFGKIFRGAKRVVGGLFGREIEDELQEFSARDIEVLNELTERELEDLYERSPIFGKIFRGVKKVAGGLFGRDVEGELTQREIEELIEREPIFGKIFGGAKRLLFGREFDDLSEREIEELSERSPIFGKIFRGVKKVAGGLFGRDEDLGDFTEREVGELYERSPEFRKVVRDISDDLLESREPLFFLPALARVAASAIGGRKKKRDLEDVDDVLYSRAYVGTVLDELD